MNKGIFSCKVFHRRRTACRVVSAVAAFAMLTVGSLPAFGLHVSDASQRAGAFGTFTTSVVGGKNVTTIQQLSKGGIIDWTQFNMVAGEKANFNFDKAGSTLFNNVSGTSGKSQIDGIINGSNGGNVWVFNPSGIAFGRNAQVNVGGLFAAAATSFDDVLNRDAIKDAIDSGSVIPLPQLGAMKSAVTVDGSKFEAGQVALLGKSVTIDGGANFEKVGTLTVGAGNKLGIVLEDDVAGGKVAVDMSVFDDDLADVGVNLGDINAGDTDHAGNVDVVTEGSIVVKGAVVAKGDIDFKTLAKDGASAPVISYKKMSVASGKLLQGKSVNAAAAGKVTVDGDIAAVDGDVTIVSTDDVIVNGTVGANGDVGGNVAVSGSNVGNFGTISVNGTVGDAGNVRIDAANAAVLGGDSRITANAGVNGNGGKVEVIAHNYANLMSGSRVEAKGGTNSGNGGFVETSGYKSMNVKGTVDATAANGKTGTWLIDPSNIEIVDNSVSGTPIANPFEPSADGTQLEVNDIRLALESANVEIKTTNAGGTEAGDIDVSAAINYADKTRSLTLTADGNVTIKTGADINGGSNDFTVNAGKNIAINADVTAKDVTFNSTEGTVKQTSGTIAAGNKLELGADANLAGDVTAATIDATGKAITQDGAGTITATAEIKAATLAQAAAGTVKTAKVTGAVTQGGGATITGAAENGSLEITDVLTQNSTSDKVQLGTGTLTLGADSTLKGDVDAGAIAAGATTLKVVDGADVDVAGNVGAGTLDVDGGSVDAATIAVTKLDQDGGAVKATTSITGAVELDGAGSTLKTPLVAGTVKQENGTLSGAAENGSLEITDVLTQTAGSVDVGTGTLKLGAASTVAGTVNAATIDNAGALSQGGGAVTANAVNGAFEQTGGTVDRQSGSKLTFGSTVTQNGSGTIGGDSTAVEVTGALDQDAGTVKASTLTLKEGGSFAGDVTAATIDATGKTITQDGAGTITATAEIKAATLAQTAAGTVKADKVMGDVSQSGTGASRLQANTPANGLTVTGTVTQNDASASVGTSGEAVSVGKLTQTAGTVNATTLTLGADGNALGGTVTAETIAGGTTVTVSGSVNADSITANISQTAGTIKADEITGTVSQNGDGALIMARDTSKSGTDIKGNVTQTKGEIQAGTLTGDLVQNAANVKDAVFTADEVTGTTSGTGTKNIATVKNVNITGGVETYGTIKGTLTQSGGTLNAKDGTLVVKGNANLSGGTTAATTDAVTFESALIQSGSNELNANVLTLKGGAEQNGTGSESIKATTLVLDSSTADVTLNSAANDFGTVQGTAKSVTLKDANGIALGNVTATAGDVGVTAGDKLTVAGAVKATKGADGTGNVTLTAGTDKTISVNGSVTADATAKFNNDADVNAGGSVAATTVDATGKGLKVKAKDGATPAGAVTADGIVASTLATAGTVKADIIDAAVTQTDGTINRRGADTTLTFKKTIDQQGGTIGDSTTPYAVKMEKSLTQSGGTLAAERLNLHGGANQTGGKVEVGNLVLLDAGQDVTLGGNDNKIGSVRGTVKNLTLKDGDGGLVIANDVSNQGLNINGTGNITTSDDLTQEGQLVAAGEFTANAANVNLSHQWNRFQGDVNATATANGGYVRLAHRGDIPGSETVNIKSVQAGTSAARGDVRIEAVDGGGILVSGAVDGKNVTLSAEKNITENVAVSATADKYVHTTAGNIDVNVAGTVGHSVAYVAEASTAKVNTGTDVTIRAGEGGTSFIQAGDNKVVVSGSGSVASKDGVTTFTDASVVAIKTTDSVVVNNAGKPVEVGTIGGESGAVNITEVLADPAGGTAHDGTEAVALVGSGSGDAVSGIKAKDVAINVTGDPGATAVTVSKAITATDGSVVVVAEKGDVNVAANITGKTGVTLTATGDNVTIGTGTAAGVVVKAGEFTDEAAGVVATGSSANLVISAGNGVAIQNGATIAATGNAEVTAKGADGIIVKDSCTKLVADKGLTVQVTTGDGNVVIKDGAYVAARNSADGNETIVSSANGSVEVSGADTAVEAGKDFTITGAKGVTVEAAKVGADGALSLNASGDNASVAVRFGARAYGKEGVTLASSKKDVVIDGAGTLVKAGTFTVDEATGDVASADGGKTLTISAADAVKITDGAMTGASGAVDVDAGAGGVEVSGASALASNGAMTIDANGGDVKIQGSSTVASASTLEIGKDGTTKNVTVGKPAADGEDSSQLVSAKNLTVKATEAIMSQNAVKVASDATTKLDGASVTVQTGAKVLAGANVDIDATGAVTVDGATVAAKKKVLVGDTTTPSGLFTAKSGATVTGLEGVEVNVSGSAKVNDVTVMAGVVNADGSIGTGSNANLAMTAGADVRIEGGAKVAASGTAEITAKGVDNDTDKNGVVVTGTGTKLVADKSLTVQATTGDGSVTISDGAYVAARNSEDGNETKVASVNGTVAVSGSATAVEAGKNLTLTGKAGVTVNASKVGADGTLKLEATGDDASVAVQGGARAYGKTGVTLDSAKDVTITGNGTIVNAGSFSVDEHGAVAMNGAAANMTVTAAGKVDMNNGANVGASGTATVTANGADGVTVAGNGTKLVSEDTMNITANNAGGVTVGGKAYVGTHGEAHLAASGDVDINTDGTKVESAKAMTLSGANVKVNAARVGTSETLGVTATTGDVTVENSATVIAKNDITVTATGDTTATPATGGNVTVDDSSVTSTAGSIDVGTSTARIGGTFTAKNDATVTAASDVKVYAAGDAKVDDATVKAGKFTVDANGTVAAETDGNLTFDASGAVVVQRAAQVGASGTADIDAGAFGVTVAGTDTKLVSNGAMTIDANGGAVNVENGAYVGGSVTVTVGGDATKSTASAKIDNAQLVARDAVAVTTTGNIDVQNNAKVASDTTLTLTTTGADGSIAVQGAKVLAANNIGIDAVSTATVAGTAEVKSANGTVTATAAAINVEDSGKIDAKTTATLEGRGDSATVTLAGSSQVKGETVVLKNAAISQTADGSKVVAETLDLQNEGKATVLASKDNEVANVKGKAGGLVLEDAVGLTVSDTLTVGGNMRLKTTVGTASIKVDGKVGVTGNATIISGKDVNVNADVKVDGDDNTLDIEAANVVTMKDNTTASTAGGNIALVAKEGNLTTAVVKAGDSGNGLVWLSAENGTIVKTTNGKITGKVVSMNAGTIGASDKPMEMDTPTLALNAQGDVFINNAQAVTITSTSSASGGDFKVNRVQKDLSVADHPDAVSGAAAATGLTSENGQVVLNNTGTITVDEIVSGKTGVTLNATDNGDIVVNPGKQISSDNGNVTLTAANNVNVNGGTVVAGVFTDTTTGAVAEGSSKNVKIEADNGVTIQNGATVAATGNVEVTAKGADGVTVKDSGTKLVSDKGMTVDATATGGGSVKVEGGAYVGTRGMLGVTATKDVTVGAEADTAASQLVSEGNLTVTASGAILAQKSSKVASDVTTKLDGASVTAKTGAKVLAGENVDIDATGAVTVDGATVAANGADTTAAKAVDIQAGTTVTVDGGTVEATAGSVNVKSTGAGNITVQNGGAVKAGDGGVKIENAEGGVTVENGAAISAAKAEGSEVAANVDIDANGNVVVQKDSGTGAAAASVTADGNVTIDTTGGNVTVDASKVEAGGDVVVGTATGTRIGGTFTAQNGATVTAGANAKVYATGDVKVDGSGTSVMSKAGDAEIDAKGNIDVTGATVSATGGDAKLTAGTSGSADNGRINITGAVEAKSVTTGEGPDATTRGGNVTLTAKGADVPAADPDNNIDAKSAVEITGTVTAEQKAKIAATQAASDNKGSVSVKGNTASVTGVQGVEITSTKGDVKVDKAIVKAGEFTDETTGTVKDGSNANMAITAGKGVTVQDGAKVAASGKVDVDSGADGVTVTGAGTKLAANKEMTIDAEAGAVAVKGGSFVGGNSTVSVGMNKTGDSGTASLTVGDASDASASQLVAKDSLTVKTTGAILAQKSSKVASDATTKLEGASVTAQGGAKVLAGANVDIDAAGAVMVDGATVAAKGADATTGTGPEAATTKAVDIQAGTTVTVQGGTVEAKNADGSVVVNAGTGVAIEKGAQNATVKAGKDVTIDTTGGNITVGKDGSSEADKADASLITAGGNVSLTADNATGQGVTIRDTTSVNATAGTVAVTAKGGISVNDTATVEAGTSVMVRSTDTTGTASAVTIDTTGAKGVTANNGNVTIENANGNVLIDKATVTATEKVVVGKKPEGTASVADVKGDVTVRGGANVTGEKGVEVYATGDVTVNNATVKAGVISDTGVVGNNSNAPLTIDAGKTVIIEGGAKVGASGTATVTAKGVDNDTDKNGVVVTGSGTKLVADKGLTVKATATDDADAEVLNNVIISGGAYVAGRNANQGNKVEISSAKGSVTVTGKDGSNVATAVEAGKDLAVTAYKDVTVKESAKVGSNQKVEITATTGDVKVENKATVIAKTGVTVTASGVTDAGTGNTTGGNVTVRDATVRTTGGDINVGASGAPIGGTFTAQSGAAVTADAGSVNVYARGDAKVLDTSKVEAKGGDAVLDAQKKALVDGQVIASANATLTAKEGVEVSKGTDDVQGLVAANGGKATLTTEAGDVVVKDGAQVTATGDADLKATKSGVTVQNNAKVLAGTLKANGAVDKSGSVTIEAGQGEGAAAGAIAISGSAEVRGTKDVTVTAKDSVKATGSSSVSATSGAVVLTAQGNDGAETDAVAVQIGGMATVEAGTSVTIKSTGAGDVTIDTTGKGTGEVNKGITANAGNVTIDNDNGAVTVKNAKVEAKGANGSVDIDATGDVTIEKGTQSATVKAGKDVLVESSAGGISVKNATVTAGKNLRLGAAVGNTDDGVNWNVEVDTGVTMSAGQNATIEAKGNVNLNSDFTATAGDAWVESQGGSVVMASGKKIEAGNNAHVKAENGTAQIANITSGNAVSVKTKGSITSVNAGDGSMNINSKKVQLESVAGDVGSSDRKIEMSVSNLKISAEKGSTYFHNSGDLTIGGTGAQDFDTNKVFADGSVSPQPVDAMENGITVGEDLVLESDGNIFINESVSGKTVAVKTGGDLSQSLGDTTVSVDKGKAEVKDMNAAITADTITLEAGGSIGTAGKGKNSSSTYLAVKGNVTATAGGDVAIAAANGTDLSVDNISAGGNVALYTTKTLTGGAVGRNPSGTVSGQNLVVTAHDFKQGLLGISVNGKELTSNNLKEGAMKPLIAIYKTKGGKKEPTVTKLPNDAIVFVDGRLAGGDIKTINTLGAVEAFPVQTPELKSEQGVFGNPAFLHDELDVANPLAVGAIDFILLDVPSLALSGDFPVDVDEHVLANGLSPTTSYWFGQGSDEEDENEDEDVQMPDDAKKAVIPDAKEGDSAKKTDESAKANVAIKPSDDKSAETNKPVPVEKASAKGKE
ncbi:MAG: filamentous hemagglutinin N-terminal domain-containing protein [Kiritimatiellae bacterium]|nr:filamentous hemagglutinin N-terminal domain-containing protein [Kiritimatiellia bacterium]